MVFLLSCNCAPAPISSTDAESISGITANGNETLYITIEGNAVNDKYFFVIASFKATLTNNDTGLSNETTFKDGNFTFDVAVPDEAEMDDELFINITNEDGTKYYGSANFTLNDLRYTNETFGTIDILIENPPPNYNKLLIFLLILALAGVFAMYALFARWLLIKTVEKRAEQIMISRRRKGDQGGNHP